MILSSYKPLYYDWFFFFDYGQKRIHHYEIVFIKIILPLVVEQLQMVIGFMELLMF